jgi:hypothetical protein
MATSIDTLAQQNQAVSNNIYSPLVDDGTIRLIRLHHGGDDDSINCSLVIREPEDASLPYEALTYVWGDQQSPATVLLDEKTFHVTRNLHQALTRLRKADLDRYIWIDALAINQVDIPERNQQVRRMRDIYAGAEKTLIWLGEGDETIESTFQLFTRHMARYQSRDRDVLEITARICNAFNPNLAVRRCLELLQLPYWERVWVFQEMMYSKSADLHYGHYHVSFSMFKRISSLLVQVTAALSESEIRDMMGLNLSMIRRLLSVALKKLDFGRESGIGSNLLMWNMWLNICTFRYCTDPRDAVFGFVGCLVPGIRSRISIDYRKSTTEVFADVVGEVIRTTQNLNILMRCDSCCWHDLNAPSWLPNFAKQPVISSDYEKSVKLYVLHFNSVDDSLEILPEHTSTERDSGLMQVRSTSEGSSYLASITDSGRILHVKGYKLGVVDRTSKVFAHHEESGDQAKAFLSHLHLARHSLRLDDMHLADLIIAALSLDISPDERWDLQIERCKAFLMHIRLRQDANIPVDVILSDLREETRLDMIIAVMFCRNYERPLFTLEPFPSISDQSNASRFSPLHVGLGVLGMKPGDTIYTIRGCSFPVVVRPTAEGRYVWIGNVYLPRHQIRQAAVLRLLKDLPGWSAQERGNLRGQHLFVPDLEVENSLWQDMEFC